MSAPADRVPTDGTAAVRADVARSASADAPRATGAALQPDRAAVPAPLTLRGIRKTFGSLTALDGVDLDIPRGRTTVLLGPSGSGKSTLLRCINLLERPDAGELDFGDGPIPVGGRMSDRTVRRVREHSTMVFQQFNLFPHLTALGNVTLAPVEQRRIPRAQAEASARELLAKVGLADKADAYPGNLSGGQQQRVAIARALAMEPDVLLFDEPTSALDPELAAEVVAVLADLAAENRTLVVVTHSLSFARRVADRVVFLEDGRIVQDGTPEEFFTSEDPRLRRFRDVVEAV
ncbi:amino acid ABC transporter ATP-binding protein [Brachybacterium sp. JHP9]|uniref:Amino acid ABC transporter ATP-binding protein n=1 Tax=Brachybacterium equifaecis TaxID=2910770 RepID=A0ABT0QZB1_9MICO|nr:amino acid ABC transporter ATP-binding protein [Brachybacterium equifaecis]MCL6422999.1 amino acid ABC transporter ATP-binding protein [Brachybacterium equifaecis]